MKLNTIPPIDTLLQSKGSVFWQCGSTSVLNQGNFYLLILIGKIAERRVDKVIQSATEDQLWFLLRCIPLICVDDVVNADSNDRLE